MDDEQKLQPCPFCGSTPEYNSYGYYHEGTESREIRCVSPDCRIKPALSRDQDKEHEFDLYEKWNTRPGETVLRDALEEIAAPSSRSDDEDFARNIAKTALGRPQT